VFLTFFRDKIILTLIGRIPSVSDEKPNKVHVEGTQFYKRSNFREALRIIVVTVVIFGLSTFLALWFAIDSGARQAYKEARDVRKALRAVGTEFYGEMSSIYNPNNSTGLSEGAAEKIAEISHRNGTVILYEWDDKNKKLDFGHNPFSMPKGGLGALEKAETTEEKLAIVADQYDMVMNGYEVASGAVRNYNPEIMYKVFNILGYNNEYVEARFGGMLAAFKFGAPPHAGADPGLDRIFMILEDEENIRDIVAFPKNGNGVDLMMNSPSPVDQIQLDEAHLAIVPEE
jgi:hypothetical protein